VFSCRGESPAISCFYLNTAALTAHKIALNFCQTIYLFAAETIATLLIAKPASKITLCAIGVTQLNQHNLQVVIGPQVQSVKDERVSLMNTVQA